MAKTPSLKASTRFVSTKRKLHFADRGAIAQLGERLDRTQEVAGSSPASSIREGLANAGPFLAPNSRGDWEEVPSEDCANIDVAVAKPQERSREFGQLQ